MNNEFLWINYYNTWTKSNAITKRANNMRDTWSPITSYSYINVYWDGLYRSNFDVWFDVWTLNYLFL